MQALLGTANILFKEKIQRDLLKIQGVWGSDRLPHPASHKQVGTEPDEAMVCETQGNAVRLRSEDLDLQLGNPSQCC